MTEVGLVSGLLGLPLAPLRVTIWAAEQVRQQAESEFYDPESIRAQLHEVDRQRDEGELTEDQAIAWEDELVERLLSAPTQPKE
ncbi:gas vesicle protein GvpG [Flexivirga endophytica]|uniref:gas vesicle protein GvpG n=1 Tax=Flexivirga endophytica TaxID=1849103 RepID=UPI001E3A8E27|nr:gas vesicle protein GvpG [Flexivirga endophytica]